jgi:hypothetical protein
MNWKERSGDGIRASAPYEQLRLEVARLRQTPSLAPPLIYDQAKMLSEISRTLTKVNVNVKRIHGIPGFDEFHEIHTALSPSLPFIFNHFKMAFCVHS